MPQIERLRLFVIPASRGFVLDAAIAQLFLGSERNGVSCLMSCIQRFASLCPMSSGRSFTEIANSCMILQLLELPSSDGGCKRTTACCHRSSLYRIPSAAG